MEKRKIDKLNAEVSLLGFGCMRFPMKGDKIDEELAEKMLDKAYAAGVNYFDTAYPYHGGDSEPFTGRVLDKYPRDSYYLATKLPCWAVNSIDDAKRIFNEQLERLHKDYVDFYLLHSLSRESFNKIKDLGVVDYVRSLKEQGKIRYMGFSFHDSYEAFEEIINYTDWDFCQIQYNYMDINEQAGDKGYELTVKKNIPLVIMEPVRGGALASFSEDINSMMTSVEPENSVASWALRWVGSHENVKVVLSGMSTMEQVDDNLKTFENFKPLSDEEEKIIANVRETLFSRVKNGCTGCRYCMPCPAGLDIPTNFKIWNTYGIYRNADAVSWAWGNNIQDSQKAKNCIKCGKCEKLCPQHINIREDLVKLQEELDKACNIK